MTVKILSENDFSNIEKLKKKFNVFRILYVTNHSKIKAVEFFNKDGVFRGFGKNSKGAFKKAKKSLKSYYQK